MRKKLWLKMLRDMRKSLITYIMCVIIVGIGFCGYSILELCYENLSEAKDSFLKASNFCSGFADVKSAPLSETRLLQEIEGVETAEGRLVKNIQVLGYEEEVQLNVVSFNESGMNQPVLSRGEYPQPGSREIVIGDGIAKARALKPGDRVRLLVSGKGVDFTVSGIGLSPENIYMIKGMADMFPDPSSYDAAFMPYDTMAGLLSYSGQANSFLLKLKPGVGWKAVEEPVKRMLAPYGVSSVYEKEDQLSLNMLTEEINQLKRMSGVVPFLFLAVAGVMIYITLSRLVEQQRTQVGTLMAMGISIGSVKLHYMGYGAFVGLLGGILGGGGGYYLSGPMADFYRLYFNLPKVMTPVSGRYFLTGILTAVLFCGITAWIVAGNLGRLCPAEALRPAAPKTAKISVLEKIPGFTKLFTVPGLMAVRNLTRNKRRTILALSGMAFAYMITATLVSMNGMFDVFIFDYWEKTQRQDIMVQFDYPVAAEDAMAAIHHSEISRVEGVMEFPVTLYGPGGKTDSSVTAIPLDSELCRLYTEDGQQVYPEKEGIVLSKHIAGQLGVKKGDTVEIKVSYPKERTERIYVTGVIAQYLGSTAYMSHEGAAAISDYRNVYSSMLIKAPPSVQKELTEQLKEAKAVSVIENRQTRVGKYRSMMGSMSAMMAAMSMMGVIIGFAVIYISSLISFEELNKEVSTLMMLGLKSDQCLEVISTGQWILAAGAVLIGIPMAMGTSYLISATMSSNLYSIPNFINGGALLQSIGLMALSVGFSSMMMLRKLKKLSPADLLKCRE